MDFSGCVTMFGVYFGIVVYLWWKCVAVIIWTSDRSSFGLLDSIVNSAEISFAISDDDHVA